MSELSQASSSQVATLPARRLGLRAKCSFLLDTLINEDATEAEQAVAAISLAADINLYRTVLSDAEARVLANCLNAMGESSQSGENWSCLLVPRDVPALEANVDGLNVQRVVIEASESDQPVVVARTTLPREGRFVIINEYTSLAPNGGTLRVVDGDNGAVLATHSLDVGHHRSTAVELRVGCPTDVRVEISSCVAGSPVRWYSTQIETVPAEDEPAVTEAIQRELRRAQKTTSDSVFQPVTGEPLLLADVDRIMGLHNKFAGERIFVMGNGPSLNRTPLDLLEGEYVFGVNRISLLLERVSWRPTFFTAFDVRVVPDNADEFREIDIPYKFFSARYKSLMGERSNHFWYHTKGFYEGFSAGFEPTVPYSGVGGGGTIGVIAIELAYFMGFREIYLIGTDVSYTVPKTVKQTGDDVFGDGVKLQLESTDDDDANHFDPRYFGKNKKWHNPNVREMKIGFSRAAAYIEERGGRLRNATVGGELEEVPRVDFETLFTS